jgi:hypothetical protein
VFAFSSYGGHDDYEWLCEYKWNDEGGLTITGLESLQIVFAEELKNPAHRDAAYMADLLVVIKFQELIHRSAGLMSELRFPLLAPAHDYDFILEVRPPS